MIRNILYSLFVHSILILLIYFSFSPTLPIIEVDRTLKVVVSFMAKSGNSVSNNVMPQQQPIPIISNKTPKLLPRIKSKKVSPIHKKQSKPKKSKAKTKPKRLDSAKKTKPKQESTKYKPKKINAKAKANKIKKPSKRNYAKQGLKKPKFKEKKPEIKEEIKKDKVEDKAKFEEELMLEFELESNLDDLELEIEDSQDEEESKKEQYSFTENSMESLDLLAREKFNIQTQIKRCYKKALQENGQDNQMVINAHIFIAQDGFIDLDVVIFKILSEKIKNGAEKEDFYRAKETIKKALKFCSPIRNLPQDKYDIWKEIDLRFG